MRMGSSGQWQQWGWVLLGTKHPHSTQPPSMGSGWGCADPEARRHRVSLTRHSSGSTRGGMSPSHFVGTHQGHPGTRVVTPAHRLGVQEGVRGAELV